ncbi:O-antigen ligase family protein, partial [bacterium]|nr:O-antigen ligase family protein [bacterium]MBU1874502.1 O-antigen ligase family protein [bacterium]
ISIIALLFVILILNMNRTIWIATLLMTLMYLIKYFSLKNVFKIISAIIILFFLFFVTLNFSKYGQIAQKYLERRFYENTIGKAALGSVWKNNRDRIYNSAFIAFLDHPLLGNGAGYTYSWKVIKMWTVDELIDKNSTSIDISPLDILVKNGIIGAIIFWYFLYVVWIEIIKYEQNSKILEIDLLIIKGLKFYFPFMVLMSFNLSILFGYPAAITLSIIFSKIFLINEEYARE